MGKYQQECDYQLAIANQEAEIKRLKNHIASLSDALTDAAIELGSDKSRCNLLNEIKRLLDEDVTLSCMHAHDQKVRDDDEDNFEYCDTDDEYYIPAGWYECILNWEEYSSVKINDGVVTHWMNLPEPSKKEW
jgi:hypothetical protein